MQIAVVFAGASPESDKPKKIASALAKGISRQGESVITVDAWRETDRKLILFDYVVVVSETLSLFSAKLPDMLKKYLAASGELSGKRASAVLTGGLRKGRGLHNLMSVVESQGIILKDGLVIGKEDEAEAYGVHLNVKRNL